MTKPELLQLMRLLSALESALMYDSTNKSRIPAYLFEEIGACTDLLERDLLNDAAITDR